MDPDTTLAAIREVVKVANQTGNEDLILLADLVAALDHWLSTGGFPPRDWAVAT